MDIFDFLALLRLSLKSVITVYGSPKTDIIKCIIDNNVMYITLYAFCITLAIIIIIIRNKSKKRRYIDWKNDTFNIGIFKREWSVNEDELLNELFSENSRLENENKLLKKQYSKLTMLLLIYFGIWYFLNIFKKNR